MGPVRRGGVVGVGAYQVRMPQLGETVEEGTVVTWLQEVGAEVARGDPLLEISTDKVDTEVESTVAGVLLRVLVGEGETVPVGAVLAEIEVEGLESGALLLSPVVRRLVDEHGIDLDDLAAFADSPKVDRKVVERYLSQRGDAAGRVVPFTRVRKVTAERMVASKATSPHVATAIEVDFEQVARVRMRAEPRLTWLPFVACAVARTLRRFERLNASVSDTSLVLHPHVNLGIAVDLDGEGLVVPVIGDADALDLPTMARRIRELADRAREQSLTPDDVSGGTFTITGQGPHGTLFTTPIINQPQVAILSVDGIRKRPVVRESEAGDEILAHHTGVLALSWDHRAVDGVYAAGYLAALRDEIERGDWGAELS